MKIRVGNGNFGGSGLQPQPGGNAITTPPTLLGTLGANAGGWASSDYLKLAKASGSLAEFALERIVTGGRFVAQLPPGSFKFEKTDAMPKWLGKAGKVVSLAEFGLGTYSDFTDPNLTAAQKAGNLGDRSAGLLCQTNQFCGAAKLGWDVGDFAYTTNFLGTKTAADWAADKAVSLPVFQPTGESWVDYINRPGGVTGYLAKKIGW